MKENKKIFKQIALDKELYWKIKESSMKRKMKINEFVEYLFIEHEKITEYMNECAS